VARILLSESDPDVRRLVALLLQRLGHDVVVLHGSEPSARGDLLLLEPASEPAVRQARRLRATHPELPIVCVSILPEDARWLELGPLTYLQKPFALDELRGAVERTLRLVGAPA
jgi:DNA-binding response OmpR family regulator